MTWDRPPRTAPRSTIIGLFVFARLARSTKIDMTGVRDRLRCWLALPRLAFFARRTFGMFGEITVGRARRRYADSGVLRNTRYST